MATRDGYKKCLKQWKITGITNFHLINDMDIVIFHVTMIDFYNFPLFIRPFVPILVVKYVFIVYTTRDTAIVDWFHFNTTLLKF